MKVSLSLSALIFAIFASLVLELPAADTSAELRSKAEKIMNNGNFAEAIEVYKELLSGKIENQNPQRDFPKLMHCYVALNKYTERETIREKIIETFNSNWLLLWVAAQSFASDNHFGTIVDGKFIRCDYSSGGKRVSSFKRDRTRAFQLYTSAYEKAPKTYGTGQSAYHIIIDYADFIIRTVNGETWLLQELTDISTLPDYEENEDYYWRGYRHGARRGAPVDNEGNPIFYSIPANFAEAKSDGERWRFLLKEATIINPDYKPFADQKYADFLLSQFGVQTLVESSFFVEDNADEIAIKDANPYAVHTLGEDETIAKLATGIKRFKLPDEHNYIKIFRELSKLKSHPADSAFNSLASIFKDRRQYTKAAECIKEGLKIFEKDNYNFKLQLSEIIDDCGEFLPLGRFPSGKNPSIQIRYRNAKFAKFEAFEINSVQFINDVKEYIKSNPKELQWDKLDLNDIGRRIILQNEKKYIGDKIASWNIDLTPKKGHYDKIQNVDVPISKPGAYLLTAKFGEGNASRITLWLNDSVIIRKQSDNAIIYYCADAISGKPLSGAILEFFGYSVEYLEQKFWKLGRRHNVMTQSFECKTNDEGLVILTGGAKTRRGENYLVSLKSPSGAISYLGFDGIWFMDKGSNEIYDGIKTYTITDRPVYRPDQDVKLKTWIGRTKYENLSHESSEYAGQQINIKVLDSFNKVIYDETISADKWGGVEGKFRLKKDCHLGNYSIHVSLGGSYCGGLNFRVEEYKKPEFEVSIDKPSEPVALGEKIIAKIKAKYYFGAAVSNAKVKYKVERYQHNEEWFFSSRWDWLYGKGYWWQSPNYEWYPGWNSWATYAPKCWWIPWNPTPPELIIENETAIGEDGTIDIVIDSSIAKALYGNLDQRYEITAEVIDASRRTIFGKGSCIAAAKPFKINAWTDAGWARPAETITANFAVRTPDGKGLAGEGKLSLFKIKYNKDGIPNEELLETWNLTTDENGFASIKIKAGNKGQYRLSYAFETKGLKGEGASVFNVFGDDAKNTEYRFNDIEIISKKSEYRDGEKAILRINTAKKDSTVLLFVRPQNGIYETPILLQLKDGTIEYLIPTDKKDMPNFFVEAITIANGIVHSTVKEIIIPPEKCTLDLEILPNKEKYKPGEKAYATLKILDANGKPVANSSVVVSIYDKAVEYISGGSNVPEIKAHFWNWRKKHYPRTNSSIAGTFWNILKPKEQGLSSLGIFGDINLSNEVPEENASMSKQFRTRISRKSAMTTARGEESGTGAPAFLMTIEAERDSSKDSFGAGYEKTSTDVAIRKNFADTAFWVANLATNERGEALVELTMPENLTTWKIKVWTMATGTRVGEGETEVLTSKDFILRLQSPRFFIEKDKVTLSAIIHNYHKSAKKTSALIELDGDCLALIDEKTNSNSRKIEINPGGETRVDWKVIAVAEGDAIIRMKAICEDDSDAMEMKIPVYVHGMTKTVSLTSVIAPENDKMLSELNVPAERREDESILELRYSPSLALALFDALPYMCEYPYGCTEQTLNKFVPLVIVRKTLVDMGLNLEDIAKKQINFDSQQIGKPNQNYAKISSTPPVFESEKFNDMVLTGLKKLEDMQLNDGGWGWFSGYGEKSYPHTTAVVVHGLLTAKNSGLDIINPSTIKRGLDWLKRYQNHELEQLCKHHFESGEDCKKKHPENHKPRADETDALVYFVLAEAGIHEKEMTRILYRDRNYLKPYSKVLYALGLHLNGEKDKLEMLKRNISQFLVLDDENQTAYLDLGKNNFWWCWHGSEIEANAFYLKLLAITEPKSDVSPRLVKYLLNNRKHASYWNSTRDTAYCIEAMSEFIKSSGENIPDMELEILFDGKTLKKQKITAENLFLLENAITLKGKELNTGTHTLEIRKSGKGPVYYSAYLSYFTLEDFITKTGLEIKIERKYHKLLKTENKKNIADKSGQVVKQKIEKYDRIPLNNLDLLKSGDLIEVELVVESKNDYEYIVLEDMKPAGLEPCEIRSGYNENEMGAFVEFRDEKVLFFVRSLPRGKHSVSYRMKAEIPGTFSALPARASAMYAPELKANSNEIKISIED